MMEIFDRLLASIGQDTLDTLFGIVADNRKGKFEYLETLFYFVVATVYVFLHTTLILVQATTLNVAINSHSTVLLTIMMSNNFVELKGCVFKKFETNNLFQMSCSDIRERFHYVIMLGVVCVSNLSQFNWDLAYLKSVLPVVVMVMVLEVVVDSIKHAFITKFNDISPDVYKEYRTLLAMDLVTSRLRLITLTLSPGGWGSYHSPWHVCYGIHCIKHLLSLGEMEQSYWSSCIYVC